MIAVQDGHEDAVTLIQSMMMRNDPSIRGRLHAIVNQYAAVFGTKRQVKSEELNARAGPSVNDSVITTLIKGQSLLEVFSQDKWNQVCGVCSIWTSVIIDHNIRVTVICNYNN